MSSRIWNSLTDYQFLADQWKEEKDQEDKEVRQILKIPAFRFWSMIFVALFHPGIASHHPAHASALRDDIVQETEGYPDLKFLFRLALFVEESSSTNPAPSILFDFQIEDHVMRNSGT